MARRMGFVAPEEELNCYPREWVHRYTSRGYMLYDPVIRWAYENTGYARWHEIDTPDLHDILQQAREFGLNFGLVIAYRNGVSDPHRSFGSFAREDRDFTNIEIIELSEMLVSLHDNKPPVTNLTAAELEVLAMLKEGMLMKQVAAELGVSESAIKARLKNAKQKLSAKTNTHAASVASDLGLI